MPGSGAGAPHHPAHYHLREGVVPQRGTQPGLQPQAARGRVEPWQQVDGQGMPGPAGSPPSDPLPTHPPGTSQRRARPARGPGRGATPCQTPTPRPETQTWPGGRGGTRVCVCGGVYEEANDALRWWRSARKLPGTMLLLRRCPNRPTRNARLLAWEEGMPGSPGCLRSAAGRASLIARLRSCSGRKKGRGEG